MNQLEKLLAMTTKSIFSINDKLMLKEHTQDSVKELLVFVENRGLIPVVVNCQGLYQNDIQGFREILGKSFKELSNYCVVLLDHELRPSNFDLNSNLICLRINSPNFKN